MNASGLLHDLAARGVILSTDGDRLDIDAPDEVLTDELLTTLRDHKAPLLALLKARPAPEPEAVEEFALTPPDAPERPRLGSCANPIPICATRISDSCALTTGRDCSGFLRRRGHNLLYCSNCDDWWELVVEVNYYNGTRLRIPQQSTPPGWTPPF